MTPTSREIICLPRLDSTCYCVERLVIDSLRLKSLEAKARRVTQTRKKPREKTGNK